MNALGYVYCLPHEHHNMPRNLIQRYARRHGIGLLGVRSDIMWDGPIKLQDRSKLAGLLAAIYWQRTLSPSSEVCVIVERSAHLADEPLLRSILLEHLRSLGVDVLEASTDTKLTEEKTIADVQRSAAPATLTQARRTVGLLKARATRIKNETSLGRKPFGSHEEEKQALDRLFELTRVLSKDGWRHFGGRLIVRRSFAEIAAILNQEGHSTRTGKPWQAATVRGIIQRERPRLWAKWFR